MSIPSVNRAWVSAMFPLERELRSVTRPQLFMATGKSLHQALRNTRIDVTVQDFEHLKCVVCKKDLPNWTREDAKYCSATCVGRMVRQKNPGPGHPRKFTDEQIAQIFELRKEGLTYKKIGEKLGMSTKTVESTVNGHLRK